MSLVLEVFRKLGCRQAFATGLINDILTVPLCTNRTAPKIPVTKIIYLSTVIRHGELVGIVTKKDLLQYIYENKTDPTEGGYVPFFN